MTVPVGAVVVRYRGGEEVARCLASLLGHGGGVPERIVLVDSGSGDGGAAALAGRFPAVRVVELGENRSFAHAANRGAREAGGGFVLLLNPDAEVETGALAPLVDHLERNPELTGVVPLLVGPDGRPQHRWQLRRLPTERDLARGRPGRPAYPAPPRAPGPVAQPAAAAWLLRREAWEALGGFDEAYAPAWWEDVDLCARRAARRAAGDARVGEGFRVLPASRVRHLGGVSASELGPEAFLPLYFRNLVRYARRHHPERADGIRRSLERTLLLRALVRPGRARAYLAARRAVRTAGE